jgi:hypothetical protein
MINDAYGTFLNCFIFAILIDGIKDVDCRVKKFYLTGQVFKSIQYISRAQ